MRGVSRATAFGLLIAGCAQGGGGTTGSGVTLGLGSGPSESSSGVGVVDSSSSSSGPDPGTTGTGSESSSEEVGEVTGTAVEVCDGADNDNDGLTDEVSESNTECNGCVLIGSAGYAYWICDSMLTWDQANDACSGRGADLASVHSDDENALIQTVFADDVDTWIGANDRAVENDFVWSDSTPFDYLNWAGSQPSNTNFNEHCVAIQSPETDWNDAPCEDLFRYACKAPHT